MVQDLLVAWWSTLLFGTLSTPKKHIERVPVLLAFWDLEKTVLHKICVSWIPQLHVHKPKSVVVETVFVGDPLYNQTYHKDRKNITSVL